jgi:hypothetical protein
MNLGEFQYKITPRPKRLNLQKPRMKMVFISFLIHGMINKEFVPKVKMAKRESCV